MVSVRPKAGLPVGEHTGALTITGSNDVSLPANLSFTVSDASAHVYALNVTAGTGGSVTGGGNYAAGAVVTVTATTGSGYKFSRWEVTSGAGTLGNASSASTTFTMPANAATIRAVFAPVERGGDDAADYIPRTLTDPATDIVVAGGSIHRMARLLVKPLTLHPNDPACNEIRAAIARGELILGFNIELNGDFRGKLTISIPVGSRYNGQTVTILHCIDGRLEALTATVVDGVASFTVDALSPFAITCSLHVPDIEPPSTGDATMPLGFVLIGLATACLLGWLMVKRRRA